MQKLLAVSVDLDEIDCYAGIHGLDSTSGLAMDAVYARALPRLSELFDALDLKATFFAIGHDLHSDANREGLRELHARGHEIANHSLSHHYDLSRRSAAEQQSEIVGCADLIEAATGTRPVGFRAPGYTVTDQLLDVLAQSGALYDSSVFPCPSYYAAKASVMGVMRLSGRTSRSILDHPRVLGAPADPYRIGARYFQRGSGLLELPIGVTKAYTGRLPFIGTSVITAGRWGARALAKLMAQRSFVNLELHGIDLADASLDGLEPLRRYQPDLRLGYAEKRAALESAITTLKAEGFRCVTLQQAAELLG